MSTHSPEMLEARIAKRDVPEVYRQLAPRYDAWAERFEVKARNRCLELAAIRDGEAVLEVAVGTGLAFVEILRKNPHGRNEGIDITEEMLARARRRAERAGFRNYRLEVGDAYHLEFPDETFDVLINDYMFDLLPVGDFPIVLSEFRRVLKPGGRLIMVNMSKGERWYHSLWEMLYRIRPAWLGGCRGIRLVPFVEAAGFKGTSRESVSELGFASEVISARSGLESKAQAHGILTLARAHVSYRSPSRSTRISVDRASRLVAIRLIGVRHERCGVTSHG